MSMVKRFQVIGSFAFVAVALAGSLVWAQPALAASRSEGQTYAANYCATTAKAYGYMGVADYIWATARDGGDTITVNQGATIAPVKINVTGLYCKGYTASAAGSKFWTDKGGVSGAFNPYPNNGANNEFDDSQDLWLNISGWDEGWHSVCTDFSTWMDAPTESSESVKMCTSIYLNIRDTWTTSGWSRVGVGNANPNVQTWPANPPAGEKPAQPGVRLYWRHGVYNDGPSSTGTINFSIGKSGFSNGWNGISAPTGSFSLGDGKTQEIGYGKSWDDYSIYDVTQDDVGKTLCQGVNWSPVNQDGGSGSSEAACAVVPYNFKLTPRADAASDAAESGSSVTVTPSLENVGPTKSYDNTSWQLLRFILPPSPGVAVPAASESGSACAPSWPSCKKLSDGSGTYMVTTTSLPQNTYTVEDLPLGTRICFAVSVNKFSASRGSGKGDDNWWNGTPDCMVVGKKPKLQVWGDDVAVRGSINTSTTQKDSGVFGSWVEYAALSVGANSQFASGAGLASQTSSAQSAWSALTFANANVPNGGFGKYTLTAGTFRPLPAIAQYFATGKSTQLYNSGADLNANAFNTGSSLVVRTAGALDLNAGSLPKGRSLVIVAGNTVTIKGNLTYTNGAMTSTRDLSQLVIIAPRIDIEDSVTTVDAWLIADETVNTCSNVTGDLSGKVCNKELAVNGPVVAGKLLLRRTAGSGTGNDSGAPAETFNTRPSTYLWAQLVATGSGRAETVETTELPPRF